MRMVTGMRLRMAPDIVVCADDGLRCVSATDSESFYLRY